MNTKRIAILSLLIISFLSINGFCQDITNNNMESWYIDGLYQHPVGWTSSNDFSLPIGPAGVSADSSSYEGIVCAKIITTNIGFAGAPYAGFIVNGKMNVTGHYDIDSIYKAGEPFSFKPDALSGFYKYESDAMIEDWGHAFVILKRYDSINQRVDTVGYGENTLLNPSDEFRYFKVDIDYFMEDVMPDSIVVAFFSTYPAHPIGGGKLWIDQISMEYATGIDVPERHLSFSMYPNPADNFIRFTGSVPAKINIYNAGGSLLIVTEEKDMIDISTLAPGIYFLRAEIEGEWTSKKFVKR